jgi:hypothetical protein
MFVLHRTFAAMAFLARRRRRRVRGASGALNAAQTLCDSASFRRGMWRLTRLLLKLLPLRRLRGGLALRRLWMPLLAAAKDDD